MSYQIELTLAAKADLVDIVDWIAHHDSTEHAYLVLDKIQAKIESLIDNPQRGVVPPELRSLGLQKYREIFFKPYRIIYHVREQRVIINLIADGRRDMATLLQRRLTAAPGM
jgi:toxin ParE1/3/4